MRVSPRLLVVLLLALGFIAGGCNNSSSSRSPSTGGVPAAPVISAVEGDQQVSVTFNTPAGATGFTLYWTLGFSGVTTSDNPTPVTGGSPFVHMGLTGLRYYYAMTASNAQGSSGLSNEVSAVPMIGAGGLNSVDIAGVGTITFDHIAQHFFDPPPFAPPYGIRFWSSTTNWFIVMLWDGDRNPDPNGSCVTPIVGLYSVDVYNPIDDTYYSTNSNPGAFTLCVTQYATSQGGQTAGSYAGTVEDPSGNFLTLTNGVFDVLRTY